MKTRQDYVDICMTCQKRRQTMKLGVVCGLTEAHADYDEVECPNYERDMVATRIQNNIKIEAKKDRNVNVFAGIGIIILAVVWLAIGVFFNRIFFVPIFLLIGGIIVLVKNSLDTPPSEHQNKPVDNVEDEVY